MDIIHSRMEIHRQELADGAIDQAGEQGYRGQTPV